MKGSKLLLSFFVLLASGLIALPADATLISVYDPASAAAIIAAPTDVTDTGASFAGIRGFDEQLDVLLTAELTVDGGSISADTVVDSHMIFLNTAGTTTGAPTVTAYENVEWTFAGYILGVMSDDPGSLEVASSPILGATGTSYPTAGFTHRGLEIPGNQVISDAYTISGNMLTVTMSVTQPGDWIRVVTAAEPIPEPATMLLLGTGLVGLAGFRKKFKK